MFKNKKLPKIQILSLVVSLTIFVGGSFNNDVIGSPKHKRTKQITNRGKNNQYKNPYKPMFISPTIKENEEDEELVEQGKKNMKKTKMHEKKQKK